MFATILCVTCDSRNVLQAFTSTIAPASAPCLSSRIEAVGIVIWARNRSPAIAGCIHSIFAASSHSGWRNSLWIVVVADACSDATAKSARGALGAFGEVLEISARCHETADRIGIKAVLEHFHQMPRNALLLASIDAGTNLRRDWFDMKQPAAGPGKVTPREAAEPRSAHRSERRYPRRREPHTERRSSAASNS